MLEQWTIFVTHRLRFVKKFTRPDFQAKDFTPLISLNFTKMSVFGNLHHWQRFYTAGGSDGSDKAHLWQGGGGSVRKIPKRREFILIAPLLAHFYSMSFHNHLDCGHIGSPSPTPISSKKKVVFVTISYWRCSHMMSIEGMYTARLTIHPCDWKWASSWDRGDRVYMT